MNTKLIIIIMLVIIIITAIVVTFILLRNRKSYIVVDEEINETLNEEKLLSFYQGKGFQQFDSRLSESASHEPHELIQLLKILK